MCQHTTRSSYQNTEHAAVSNTVPVNVLKTGIQDEADVNAEASDQPGVIDNIWIRKGRVLH